MKRQVLLVDDEIAVLLTLKTVLEISDFSVDTATSARDAQLKLKKNRYDMVITDMRMESDQAGRDVILAARMAPYHPAVALLTAFPEDDWQDLGADKMLVKPMQTRSLIQSIERLLETHQAKLKKLEKQGVEAGLAAGFAAGVAAAKAGSGEPANAHGDEAETETGESKGGKTPAKRSGGKSVPALAQ